MYLKLLLSSVVLFIPAGCANPPARPRVWGVELVAGCRVEVYSPMQQPQWTVAWSCPGEDMILFWPLPMYYPWFEKPLEPPGMGPGDRRA